MAQKTLYHSELVAAGECNLHLKVNGPQKSQFSGKPDYFLVDLNGAERILNVENASISQAISGYQGQTLLVKASGRGEDAFIEILGGGAAPQPNRQPAAHQPPRQQPPPQQQRQQQPAAAAPARNSGSGAVPDAAFNAAAKVAAQCGVLMTLALRRAMEAAAVAGFDGASEDVRAMANTIFIELKGLINVRDLPTKIPDRQPPRQQRQPPPRQPEPEPDPADYALPEPEDDIPF